MAHFAQIDENNIVIQVLVTDSNDPNGDEGYQWLIENLGGTWIQTSYNTRAGIHYDPETGEANADQSKALRKNFAGVGDIYHADIDAFSLPKPYDSWVLDPETALWQAPVEYPTDGQTYRWNEDIVNWELVETEEE